MLPPFNQENRTIMGWLGSARVKMCFLFCSMSLRDFRGQNFKQETYVLIVLY